MLLQTIRSHLRILFNEAVASVNPQKLIQDNVKVTCRDGMDCLLVGGKEYHLDFNVYIVGFGKAVLGMARTVEQLIKPHVKAGVISVPVGTLADPLHLLTARPMPKYEIVSNLQIIECAKNNLPDTEAQIAAQKITDLVKGVALNRSRPTILIVLISGGGSALLPLPVSTISLEEKLHVIKMLGNAGANIVELNCVRKKLSQVKGGGLARIAYPTQVISLIISDVVGDPIDTIASGPTSPSFDLPNRPWEVILKYNLDLKISKNIVEALTTNYVSRQSDFSHVTNLVIGNNSIALTAIKTKAHSLIYNSLVLSDKIQGIARDIGSVYAALATNICLLWSSKLGIEQFIFECEAIQNHCNTNFCNSELNEAIYSSKHLNKPLCLILGGETTVQVSGSGIGGRNQELALAFAINMFKKCEMHSVLKNFEIVLLSAGTDGIDGPTDVAGAIGYSHLVYQAQTHNVDPSSFLNNNDSYNFFAKLYDGKDFIKTGHTGTNVMDVHILVIAPCQNSSDQPS